MNFFDYFVNPWGLIGLIGVPILILIYIIRHRYHEVEVPSTYLWKRSLKYMKKRLPLNLRNILLLILQILAVILVSLILARPTIPTTKTGDVIAILDASSSMMAADDAGVSRFERAKTEIKKLAEEADSNSRVTVIVAGSTATMPVRRSDARLYINQMVDRCECSWGDADITGALEIAQSVLKENKRAKVVYYTDTTYNTLENIETVSVVGNEWNAAAQGLEVQQVKGAFSFTGKVVSYGRDETLNVMLYVNDKYVDVQKVVCRDGVVTDVDFRDKYTARTYDSAEIVIETEGKNDAFEADNHYVTYFENEVRMRVEVVFAPGHYDAFLPLALGAANINYQVVTIDSLTAEGYENRQQGNYVAPPKVKYSGYGAYIFVGMLPEYLPDDGTTWLMNPPQIPSELGLNVSIGEEVADNSKNGYAVLPGISADEEEFKILEGLTLVDTNTDNKNDTAVRVLKYRPIVYDGVPAEGDTSYKPLLTCQRYESMTADPVFVVGKNANHSRVIISTLLSSNLSAGLEYTLLVKNLIDYAYPEIFEGGNREVGDSAEVIVPAGATTVSVKRDGVTVDSFTAKDATVTFDKPGDYTIAIDVVYRDENDNISESNTMEYYSFVSIAESESNLYRNLDKLSSEPPADGIEQISPVEIWIYLLIALLVVLTAEWWVYYRA